MLDYQRMRFLAAFLFFIRNGFSSRQPLEELARRSLPPEIALTNNRPTIFEFYADWCEVCQQMAPAMLSVEKLNRDKHKYFCCEA